MSFLENIDIDIEILKLSISIRTRSHPIKGSPFCESLCVFDLDLILTFLLAQMLAAIPSISTFKV